MSDLQHLMPEHIFPWGRPADLWIKYIDVIRDMVTRLNLKEFGGAPSPRLAKPVAKGEEQAMLLHRPPFPGGLRIAHLHFEDKLYLLNDEQWKAFSTQVMKNFRAKLAKVNTVNFSQVMSISHAVDPLVFG